VTSAEARAILQRFGECADLFADCFGRRVQRDAARRYLAGLVNDSARKCMQAMHGRLSDAGTYAMPLVLVDHHLKGTPQCNCALGRH
jgi:hypothetical protein